MGEEEGEDLKFGFCKGYFFAIEAADFVVGVDAQALVGDLRFERAVAGYGGGCGFACAACYLGAAEDGVDSGCHFADLEGLGDVVVGSDVEAHDGVVFSVEG